MSRAPLPSQLMKVTDLTVSRGDRPVFICDFSPPRFADWNVVQRAGELSADFLCVAYNPGKAVRVDSAMLASAIKTHTGKETVFNLATRDMNRLALQTHLLGAQMLGLENVVVVKGDNFSGRDLERVKASGRLPAHGVDTGSSGAQRWYGLQGLSTEGPYRPLHRRFHRPGQRHPGRSGSGPPQSPGRGPVLHYPARFQRGGDRRLPRRISRGRW